MSTTRLHHSLPAPVVHAGFSVPQSKSHVLAGVQDAYWSDDEAEDAECPLCLEEMDISDLNFKPCVCGYQICRFCWHHIKENLNKRCPACRRVYTDDAVEFKAIAAEDHKRLTQQKKQRDRERKDLEALGRKQLANVRVVQRNVVYVVGIGPRFAKEELISTLRSNEYFGQYGKITKILLVKRNSPGGGGPVVGLYITYHRKEDAARCIAAVDGVASPGGGRDVMRASYGTTKYCMAFLRGVSCSDHSCMNLHEWGDEKDCFTKEDLATLKHTIKATESRTRTVFARKGDEDASLPRAAAWGQKGASSSFPSSTASNATSPSLAGSSTSRPARRPATTRLGKSVATSSASNETRSTQTKASVDRKLATASHSRPSTPATGTETSRVDISDTKPTKKKEVAIPPSNASPAPSVATSDGGSVLQEAISEPSRPGSTIPSVPNNRRISITKASEPSFPPGLSMPPGLSAPPGLPVPPGLSAPPGPLAPPGLTTPSRPPRGQTESPQTPLLASQSSYQMSNAARALLEDVKARRESLMPSTSFSPFPDFDRTLQTLSGEDGAGFSFNLDPKLANEAISADQSLEFDTNTEVPFQGSYVDAFPALRTGYPNVDPAHAGNHAIYDASTQRSGSGLQFEKPSSRASNYVGSFNPFSETAAESVRSSTSTPSRQQHSPVDEERKVSRFGFARGRQTSTAASSPLHSVSPLSYAGDHHAFYQTGDDIQNGLPWQHAHDSNMPLSLSGSPMNQPAQVQPMFLQNQNRLPALTGALSEAQLRNFILSNQGGNGLNNSRHMPVALPTQFLPPRFDDPAIMSASFANPANQPPFPSMAYGPPPGLPTPQRPTPPPMMQAHQNIMVDNRGNASQVHPMTLSPTLLSAEDFPALSLSASDPPVSIISMEPTTGDSIPTTSKAQEKAERKASKKAALTQKALEKQQLAQEKADAKAAEKAKMAREKAAEREMAEKEATHSVVVPVPPADDPKTGQAKQQLPVTPTLEKKKVEPAIDKPPTLRKTSKTINTTSSTSKRGEQSTHGRLSMTPTIKEQAIAAEDTMSQVPLLSKKPKKNKSVVKVVKIFKEEDVQEEPTIPSIAETTRVQGSAVKSSAANSRSQSLEKGRTTTSVHELLQQVDAMYPSLDLGNHPFFDPQKLTAPVKMPLEYGPLVHALSALSVGGGSFANNIPSGSIDNAVSSFQQLLETLTQTISDLLRLLPRTTWDDSSSFDGVLRDMLKGDDFLDDGAEDGTGKEDEVAALTLALERRARWMEVQLSKLEELHRDINTAAVKAVLSFNDNGWDRNLFLPRNGNSLARFNTIGTVEDGDARRPMTADELEKKLSVAKEAAVFAETEIREAMERYQMFRN